MPSTSSQTDERYIRVNEGDMFHIYFKQIHKYKYKYSQFDIGFEVEQGEYKLEELALELQTQTNTSPFMITSTFSPDVIRNRIEIDFDDCDYIGEVFHNSWGIEFVVNITV